MCFWCSELTDILEGFDSPGRRFSWGVLLESFYSLHLEGLGRDEVSAGAVLCRALSFSMLKSSRRGGVVSCPHARSTSGSST